MSLLKRWPLVGLYTYDTSQGQWVVSSYSAVVSLARQQLQVRDRAGFLFAAGEVLSFHAPEDFIAVTVAKWEDGHALQGEENWQVQETLILRFASDAFVSAFLEALVEGGPRFN